MLGEELKEAHLVNKNSFYLKLPEFTDNIIFGDSFFCRESLENEKVIHLKVKYTNNANKWYKNKVP